MARPVVTLLTDFGAADAYVAAVKGAVLGANPRATLVDITHQVPPQDVVVAAFLLGAAAGAFPRGAIHVAVVDPGVGTGRRALVLAAAGALYVGPDNGIFSLVLPWGPEAARGGSTPAGAWSAPVPQGVRAYELTEPGFWRHPVSATFHARDIFGPVAGHLSRGVPPSAMGRPVERLVRLAPPRLVEGPGRVEGEVVHVDRFGNLVTNIPAGRLPSSVVVEVAGQEVRGLSPSYEAGRGLVVVVGSGGTLEVSVPGGNAAAALGVGRGAAVVARSL